MSKLSLSVNQHSPHSQNAVSDFRPCGPSAGTETRLEIDASRPRQTERATTPFRTVLSGGVSVLMTGAEVATHVVAGPVLAAAVHDARVGATNAIGGSTGALPAGAAGATAALPAAAGATTDPAMTKVDAMMDQGQMSNYQLLALQQQIQQENQQFTAVSNVLRAKHDTAKAAVSNIRA
jgi:hypothetical protein